MALDAALLLAVSAAVCAATLSALAFSAAAAAAAACLALALGVGYSVNNKVASLVSLDVNPSVEVKINCFDRVVSAEAANNDGKIILEDMNLKNTKLDVAMNAILGSMVKHGYLNDHAGTVLVSVECADQERADKLRIQVSSRIEEDIDSLIQSGTVLSQQVQTDDDLEDLAEEFGMTQGKAALLRKIVSENPKLVYEDLAKLSMSELMDFLQQEDIDISDHVEDQIDEILDSDDDDDLDDSVDDDDQQDEDDDLDEDDSDNDDTD